MGTDFDDGDDVATNMGVGYYNPDDDLEEEGGESEDEIEHDQEVVPPPPKAGFLSHKLNWKTVGNGYIHLWHFFFVTGKLQITELNQ